MPQLPGGTGNWHYTCKPDTRSVGQATIDVVIWPASGLPGAVVVTMSGHPYGGTLVQNGDIIAASINTETGDLLAAQAANTATVEMYETAANARSSMTFLFMPKLEQAAMFVAMVDTGPSWQGTCKALAD